MPRSTPVAVVISRPPCSRGSRTCPRRCAWRVPPSAFPSLFLSLRYVAAPRTVSHHASNAPTRYTRIPGVAKERVTNLNRSGLLLISSDDAVGRMHVLPLSLSLSLRLPLPNPCFDRRSRGRRASHTLAKIYSLSLLLYLRRRYLVTELAQKRAARTTWRLCQRRGLCPSACRTGAFNSAPFRPVPVSLSLRRSRASRSLTFPLHDALLSSFAPLRSAMHSRS